jgi:hypothetical protein
VIRKKEGGSRTPRTDEQAFIGKFGGVLITGALIDNSHLHQDGPM